MKQTLGDYVIKFLKEKTETRKIIKCDDFFQLVSDMGINDDSDETPGAITNLESKVPGATANLELRVVGLVDVSGGAKYFSTVILLLKDSSNFFKSSGLIYSDKYLFKFSDKFSNITQFP